MKRQLTWVKIRYTTKRGAHQSVTVVDVLDNVSVTEADLVKHGCTITPREVI